MKQFLTLNFVLSFCFFHQGLASPVIVNEFNAVSSSQTLSGGGSDSQFGTVPGNGGDWLELVVVGSGSGSTVDMRGWKIEAQRVATTPFTPDDVIVLSNDSYWSNVPAGTILTFVESRSAEGGLDTSLDATDFRSTEGWAHSNIWIGDPVLITYTDSATNGYDLDPINGISGVNLNDQDTQIRISDNLGTPLFGPAGEGVHPAENEVSDRELFVLQQTPGSSITPTSHYGASGDGGDRIAHSTFGRPNRWSVAGETFAQSFAGFLASGASPVLLTSQENVRLLSGDPFAYQIQSLDVDGDPLSLSLIEGPGFLTLTDNGNGNGQLFGTPLLSESGTYLVRIQVSDNTNGSHQQTFVLTVIPRTAPLILNEYNAVSTTEVLSKEWSFDQRFGRVRGNGDDWIELVVVGNGVAGSTVDLRGWQIQVVEDGIPAGTIILSNNSFWQSMQTGSILTFTESNTVGGGLDTSLLVDNRFAIEGWAWSNIYLGDAILIDQVRSIVEIGIVGDDTQITILNSSSETVGGPFGEGLFSSGSVNNTEVFRLAADPSPSIHPLTPQYGDADTSTFGAPNRLPENDGSVPGFPTGSGSGQQSFKAFATGAVSAAPYFTNLWATPVLNNVLPGSTWNAPTITALDSDDAASTLSFSLVSPPSGLTLLNHGNGSADLSWTPIASQAGVHDLVIRVSDPGGAFLTRTVRVAVMPATSPVLVNEYNAVSSSRFLNGGTASLDLDSGTAMDAFFGRIEGNGGDWIELVVVGDGSAGSTVDMRGWLISISFNSSPLETIVLSQHPYFSAVQAGTILTFVEHDAIHGGLDSAIHRINRFQDLGYAWTNIVVGDEAFVDQLASTFGRSIPVNDQENEITVKNANGVTMNGPVGEPRLTRNVSADEVFHLERNPAPNISASIADPGFPNYADNNESSSFGSPNHWLSDVGGIPTPFEQSFLTYLSASNTNSIPTFTQLPTYFYGLPDLTHSQPITAHDFDGNGTLSLSLVDTPNWVTLTDSGNGLGTITWTPTNGVSGFQDISLRASDGTDSAVRHFQIFVHFPDSPVILNEYNAVSGNGFLNDGTADADGMGGLASDQHFGRVVGNGGDWLELVVVGDDKLGALDMRGWRIELTEDAAFPFAAKSAIQLSNDPYWSAVPHGTILTFTEDRTSEGGMDTSINEINRLATDGWAWSNIWIGDPQLITYTSPIINGYLINAVTGGVSNLDVTSVRTQFMIKNSLGSIVYGPAGEGISPIGGITSQSVWELVGDPRSTTTPHDLADLAIPAFGAAPSTTESTFGHPNRWNNQTAEQNFSAFMPPYDAYVAAAGLSAGDALISADPDSDGYTNGQEFAHGSDPNNHASFPQFLISSSSPGSLTFLRRTGGNISDGVYRVDGFGLAVRYSTDLLSWETTALEGTVPDALPTPPAGYEYANFSLPPSVLENSARAFMRVLLTIP